MQTIQIELVPKMTAIRRALETQRELIEADPELRLTRAAKISAKDDAELLRLLDFGMTVAINESDFLYAPTSIFDTKLSSWDHQADQARRLHLIQTLLDDVQRTHPDA